MLRLIYRGIPYGGVISFTTRSVRSETDRITYRGNSLKGKIAPKFPLFKYLKQLLAPSESQQILDPTTLWYEHQRQFLEDCLNRANVAKLERCWTLTAKIELSKALKAKPKIQLKYRGVTYYQ